MNKLKIILSNGNYKSGSTWVTSIIKELINYQEKDFPSKYQQPKRKNYINRYKILDFVRDNRYSPIWVSKTHIYESRIISKLDSISDEIRIVNIDRDLKDVVVSHYFHLFNNKKINYNFEDYFNLWGKYKAKQVFDYSCAWKRNKQSLNLQYEDLITEFDEVVEKISEFINVELTEELLLKLKQNTKIDNLRSNKKQNLHEEEWFFRKGESGDWKNYFNSNMIKDIERIQTNQLTIKENLIYLVKFKMRIKFKFMVYRFAPKLFTLVDKVI